MLSIFTVLFYISLSFSIQAQSASLKPTVDTKLENQVFLGGSLIIVDTVEHQHYCYEFDINSLVEGAEHTLPDGTYAAQLCIKKTPEESYIVTIDLNGDGSLVEETTHHLLPNTPLRIPYPFFSKGRRILEFLVSVSIESFGNSVMVSGIPLLKYKVVDHQIPNIDSILYYPDALLPRIHVYSRETSSKDFFILDEPFKIGSYWYSLESPNLFKQTIKVRRLAPKEKPLGYRLGYYVDMERLRQQVNKNVGKTLLSKEQKYTLHHFWGPWCAPCIKELEEVRALEQRLQKSNVQMINYCFIFARNEQSKIKSLYTLKKLIEANKVNSDQVQIILPNPNAPDCPHVGTTIHRFKESCDPIQLLNIHNYPAYVLIDPSGKIIYKGKGLSKDSQLNKLLDHLIP